MYELLQLCTVQRRLYSPALIPWPLLLTEQSLQTLGGIFKFKGIAQEQGPQNVVTRLIASSGEFATEDGGPAYPVESLVIESSVLQVQIVGDSKISDKFFELIGSFFAQINKTGPMLDMGLVRTYQTVAVVKMDIPFSKLLGNELIQFLDDKAKSMMKLENGEPEISLERLSFSVKYKMATTDYLYMPKVLTFEPRQGSRPSDNIYFTSSPTATEIHLAMLDEFESALSSHRLESSH